ncbi:glycosyltransferase [Acetobacter pasteurianus]|uniref:glycosyltransferase n=1 Tax=Acetobacter pasteurianus TaxID=438 RepID=UPI003D142BF4
MLGTWQCLPRLWFLPLGSLFRLTTYDGISQRADMCMHDNLEWNEQTVLQGTCAAIVTYGNRVHFLKQVLEGVFGAGAGHAIVVDNGTEKSVAAEIASLSEIFGASQLTIVRLPTNTGSAGGFHAAIQAAAAREDTQHVWVLDDDNRPEPASLTALAKAWNGMGADTQICLSSFREDKTTYKKLFKTSKFHGITKNSFFGFSMQTLLRKQKAKIWQKDGLKCLQMQMSAYGGFWFHKSWIQKVGLPDTRLFLYFDDYDFTLRITANGGQIWACQNSVLKDLELSWQVHDSALQHWLREEENFSRTYFSIRNRVYIERGFVKNKYIYDANIILYFLSKIVFKNRQSIYYHLLHPRLVYKRWKLILQAIKAGKAADFQTPPPKV